MCPLFPTPLVIDNNLLMAHEGNIRSFGASSKSGVISINTALTKFAHDWSVHIHMLTFIRNAWPPLAFSS